MALNNLLPYGGEVNYYGRVMNTGKANQYLNTLLDTIQWKNDKPLYLAGTSSPNVK